MMSSTETKRYRICKSFEVESGHMLSKHAERCRFPHGHSRRIEVVLSAAHLDDHDMVCDFKAVKTAVGEYLDQFDHAMAINSEDPFLPALREASERVIVFDNTDPTTEIMAKAIFDFVEKRISGDGTGEARGSDGEEETAKGYQFPSGLRLERIRVWETSTSWAEYGVE